MEKEFVATVYIIWEGKVLLHLHKKFQKYLPPGGHLEEGEDPSETAIREVKEETNLEISFSLQENIWLQEEKNCQSLPRPYLCLLEHIDIPGTKPHKHIDFVYLAEPKDPQKKPFSPFLWLSLEEIEALDPSLFFPDTIKILHLLLKPIPKEAFPLV